MHCMPLLASATLPLPDLHDARRISPRSGDLGGRYMAEEDMGRGGWTRLEWAEEGVTPLEEEPEEPVDLIGPLILREGGV